MLLPLTKPSRIKDGANNCIKTMPFYKFAGFKTSIADELLQLFHSLPFCWHITLERLRNSFAYGIKQLAKFSLGGIGKTPAVVNFHFVKVDLLGGCISVLHFIENIKHPRFEKFAFAFPSVSGDKITKNKKQSCAIGKSSPISIWGYPQQQQKEHHNVFSLFCKFLCRFAICVVHCAGTVVLNIQHLFCICKKETRAIPAGVEVEKIGLRKITPPANNLIWCRSVMCFYLLSGGLGMWVHIDLFLTRLGFCHKITSLLKSEARLGGSFTIPLFQNLSKKSQNKFAFPAFGGIVTIKGLETLANSGCNADIVGVSPVQLFYKSILGLSSGIYASTTISVFPARQALFVCAWKRRQKETKNCLTNRRAESCEALAHPAVSGKFPEKSHSTFAIHSSRAIVSARSLKTLSNAVVATVKATTSPQHILDLERAVPARISAQRSMRFQPLQVLFRFCVKTDAKIQSTICNLFERRITPCHKTNRANSPSRNSARISSAVSALLAAPTKPTRTCHLVKTQLGNSRSSRCGSTTESPKSRQTVLTVGLNQFEQCQAGAGLISKPTAPFLLKFQSINGVSNYVYL